MSLGSGAGEPGSIPGSLQGPPVFADDSPYQRAVWQMELCGDGSGVVKPPAVLTCSANSRDPCSLLSRYSQVQRKLGGLSPAWTHNHAVSCYSGWRRGSLTRGPCPVTQAARFGPRDTVTTSKLFTKTSAVSAASLVICEPILQT